MIPEGFDKSANILTADNSQTIRGQKNLFTPVKVLRLSASVRVCRASKVSGRFIKKKHYHLEKEDLQ